MLWLTGGVGEDGFMVQQVALFVETNHLASSAESRVDAHDSFLSKWCREQQLTKVLGKNADGLFVGSFFAQGSKFVFDRRFQEPFVTVFDSLFDKFSAGARKAYVLVL